MKKTWMSLLSFVLAAAILSGGYAVIALSDRFLGRREEVTQLPKDNARTAVRRFDGGDDIRLYPFDEKRDDECVPLTESVLYEKAFALWKEVNGLEESSDEALAASRREHYREELNDALYERLDWLSGQFGDQQFAESASEAVDADSLSEWSVSRWWIDHLPDLVGNTVYQASNDMCYIQRLPVWVVQDGLRQQRLLTAAFRVAYEVDDIVAYYFSLVPSEGEETPADTAALEQTAGMLVEQFDTFQKAAFDGETADGTRLDEVTADNPFGTLYSFFNNRQIDGITSRESVLYGEDLWFVLQSADVRLVLLYSPATGQFYGVSLSYGPQT